jgi:cytochrome c-type biogenesis protein CcmF
VTFAGIAGMGLATDALVALKPGEAARLAGYEWRLESVRDAIGPNWSARRATLVVTRDGAAVTVLEPERRFFPVGRMSTTEAAIHTNWARDLYAVLGEERDDGTPSDAQGASDGSPRAAILRLHHNPLAPWIWLGAAVMALGGGLSLSDRRVRVAAPAPKGAPVPA